MDTEDQCAEVPSLDSCPWTELLRLARISGRPWRIYVRKKDFRTWIWGQDLTEASSVVFLPGTCVQGPRWPLHIGRPQRVALHQRSGM